MQLLDLAGTSDVFIYANNLLAGGLTGIALPCEFIMLTATDSWYITTSVGLTLLDSASVQQRRAPIHTLLVTGLPTGLTHQKSCTSFMVREGTFGSKT